MPEETIVGLYLTLGIANEVCTRLQAEGFARTDINVGAREAVRERTSTPQQSSGFWDWLFGSNVSDDERERYSGHLLNGSVAVSVHARSDPERERAAEVMEQFDPIDIQGSDGHSVALKTAANPSGTETVSDSLRETKVDVEERPRDTPVAARSDRTALNETANPVGAGKES